MQCYPILPAPWQAARLPLPDSTAEHLIDAMLIANGALAHERLVALLRGDPALALWTVLRSDGVGVQIPTFSQLATELQNRLPECLVATQSIGEDDSTKDQATGPHIDRAVLAIEVAVRAERMARDDAHADADTAYLLAQLSCATAWLDSEQLVALPPWLAAIAEGAADEGHSESAEWAIARRACQNPDESPAAASPLRTEWTRRCPLADRLPDLAARLTRLEQLEGSFSSELEEAKLQAMYKLAAGAGHEINNPLGSIAGRAQLLLRDETDPDRQRSLAKINTQAFRAHEMISDMMLFAKPPTPVIDRVDLVALIDGVVQDLQDLAKERSTQLSQTSDADEVLVDADPTQLTVALRAMCTNALEALGSGGHIELTATRVSSDGEPATAKVVVRDDGPGIAPEQRQHIFDPFYSGREAGRGLGFGLSKCWRIVRNHGGQIEVESAPGHGAAFTITLPAA